MSGKSKEARFKFSGSRPSTPVERGIASVTNKLAAIASPHQIFKSTASASSKSSPIANDQPSRPGPSAHQLPNPIQPTPLEHGADQRNNSEQNTSDSVEQAYLEHRPGQGNDPQQNQSDPMEPSPPEHDANQSSNPEPLIFDPNRNLWEEVIKSNDEFKDWPPEEWQSLLDGQTLLEAVTQAKNKCLKGQWTITIVGKVVNLRECFTKIVGWVQKFAQIGDAAVQYLPAPAAPVWAAFRFLLRVAVNEVAVYGGILEGLERVSWLISYTSAHEYQFRTYYAKNSQQAGGGQFITDLSSIYKAILHFLKSAHGYYERNKIKRVVLSTVETDTWIKELMGTIDNRKARMEEYAELLSRENVHAHLKGIRDSFNDLEPTKDQV